MKEEKISVEPFNESQLKSNGYDVRLGPIYYILKEELDIFFPFAKDTVEKSYVKKEAEEKTIHVDGKAIKGRFIRLPPHGFAIAATIERIGTFVDIVASLRCRSSLARAGISIARCAGWGDVGFNGVWTMEVVNHLSIPYYLPVGLRVGQIVFLKTQSPAKNPYAGKYAGSKEPALPRIYADEDLATLIEVR
jgi:dCTP deaminase